MFQVTIRYEKKSSTVQFEYEWFFYEWFVECVRKCATNFISQSIAIRPLAILKLVDTGIPLQEYDLVALADYLQVSAMTESEVLVKKTLELLLIDYVTDISTDMGVFSLSSAMTHEVYGIIDTWMQNARIYTGKVVK